MRIELERGLITSDETDISIQTVARIPVEELKKIGDDEAIGTLLVEFIHKMTSLENQEGLMINKDLVDMLSKDFNDKDDLVIGFKEVNKDTFEPSLSVLKEDGSMAIIEKKEEEV